MPYSIEFPLALPRGDSVDAHLLRNNVYRWLKRSGEPRDAHAGDSAPRPFRVSTLASSGKHGSFRISLLDDSLLDPLTAGMREEPFVLAHETRLHFSGVPDVVGAGYDEIVSRAGDATSITLEFMTPTAFRVEEMAYVLPDPVRVFESYLTQWNLFSPIALRIAGAWLDWLRLSVVISRHRLETGVLRFDTHSQIGFTGRVSFGIPRARVAATDKEPLRILNFLADYAFFCGTGHKTSQGMGQTRRVL